MIPHGHPSILPVVISVATEAISPLWATLAITSLSALGALLGGTAAFIGVGRKKSGEHEDVICKRMIRVFETSFDGKLVVNREMLILAANRQARAITGFGTELIGRSIYDIIPKRFHESHRKHVQRYLNDPHPRKMGKIEMTLYLVDRQQIEKEVLLSLSPAETEYGEIEVAIGIQVVQE